MVCLHHFSEPAWLLEKYPRGWAEDGVREAFLRFCAQAADALKGLVPDWLVFNEPMVFVAGAYGTRYFPPGGWGLLNPRGALLSTIARLEEPTGFALTARADFTLPRAVGFLPATSLSPTGQSGLGPPLVERRQAVAETFELSQCPHCGPRAGLDHADHGQIELGTE